MTMISSEDENRWRTLIERHRAFLLARMDLRQKGVSLVELVRRGLNEPSERATALDLLQSLSVADQKVLFPEVLAVAAYGHGLTDEAIRALHTLPKDWVLENVEASAEPLLRDGTYEEYRMLLRIYAELSLDLARALALRARASEDPDIREAGEDFQQAHPPVDAGE
jgi:hypothetical protein